MRILIEQQHKCRVYNVSERNKLASIEVMQVQNSADPPSDPFNSIGCRTISVAKNKLI